MTIKNFSQFPILLN